jgi:hypothetical protein
MDQLSHFSLMHCEDPNKGNAECGDDGDDWNDVVKHF